MRILYLSSFVPEPGSVGGGAVVMWQTAVRLSRRHEVTAIAFDDPRRSARVGAREVADGLHVQAVDRPLVRAGAVVRRAGYAATWLLRPLPLRQIAFRSAAFQRAIDRAAASNRFDLVHVADSAVGQYVLPRGVPSLLIEHEVRDDYGETAEAARWKQFQRTVWRRFDLVQTFTRRDALRIIDLVPERADRVRVNPFGVEVPERSRDSGPDCLLFVGGFLHPPNVDAVLWFVDEILPVVRAEVPAVRLVVAGADPPDSVRALARGSIEVTGEVPSLRPYLETAAVVVAPLRRGGGMRVKVLEAMAHARPVVATRLAAEGVADDVAQAPLVLADEPGDFARAIVRLLGDPAERRRLGAAARAHVREHRSWDAYLARLERSYDELLRPL